MVPKFVKPETLAKKVELPAVATHKGHERFDPYYELLAIHATVEPDDLTTEPYLSALASTMYAVVFTQGHLAYHVSFLSRFSSKPTKKAWDALVIVMTYMYQKRSHHYPLVLTTSSSTWAVPYRCPAAQAAGRTSTTACSSSSVGSSSSQTHLGRTTALTRG